MKKIVLAIVFLIVQISCKDTNSQKVNDPHQNIVLKEKQFTCEDIAYQGLQGYNSVKALKWAKWPEGIILEKPVYGAIAVKTRNGGGHVGFVAGEKDGKIIILGGNQSQKLQCAAYETSVFFAYVVPLDYIITNQDYLLPQYFGNPSVAGSEK